MPVGTGEAGAALALSLDRVYEILRDVQKVAFVYLLVNGVLLTLVGVIRLSRVAVKPIERLRKRAETYQDDGSVLFVQERGDSEFSRLSKALNRMLQRISDDRETLRETVRSLEKSNFDLKKAQNDIIQAEKLASVGRLSSGIAHEIGNPIGIVLGYLELLDQTGIPEKERKEYIQRAQEEINRISTILRQLLDFSRPASGKSETVSVHGLLNDMFEMVRVQPLMAHVAVDLDLAARHHEVDADPNQLRQVFLNLVINAADAVSLLRDSERGRLTIGSENPAAGSKDEAIRPGMLKLRFADNGPGIAEKDLGNVFDPFFTTKAPGKGTGLGLSVCFMIIEKIGGRIFAERNDPEGTVITIYLPLSEGEGS
jgi:signal transduction histidine kinase